MFGKEAACEGRLLFPSWEFLDPEEDVKYHVVVPLGIIRLRPVRERNYLLRTDVVEVLQENHPTNVIDVRQPVVGTIEYFIIVKTKRDDDIYGVAFAVVELRRCPLPLVGVGTDIDAETEVSVIGIDFETEGLPSSMESPKTHGALLDVMVRGTFIRRIPEILRPDNIGTTFLRHNRVYKVIIV